MTAPASAEANAGKTVLIVDDDSFMRDLLARVLSAAGMAVACYASAADLLAQADLAASGLLLLDVRMPGMSGLELQALLRQRQVDLPVIFVSGVADLAMAVTAMRNGAVDFIEKPVDGASLVERVRSALLRRADDGARAGETVDPQVRARFETLTPREREIFELLVTGLSSKEIARELGGSFRTVEIHRAQVMRKMEARHLADLVRMRIESLAAFGLRGD